MTTLWKSSAWCLTTLCLAGPPHAKSPSLIWQVEEANIDDSSTFGVIKLGFTPTVYDLLPATFECHVDFSTTIMMPFAFRFHIAPYQL